MSHLFSQPGAAFATTPSSNLGMSDFEDDFDVLSVRYVFEGGRAFCYKGLAAVTCGYASRALALSDTREEAWSLCV